LPVTYVTGHAKVVDRLLRNVARVLPCSHGGNTRYKQKKTLVSGGEREIYEITHSADVWLKGREGPVEVYWPLVI
jgi:hypothetical protein